MSATVFRLPTVERQFTRKPVLRSSLVNVMTVTAMKPSFRFFSQRLLSNNTQSLANPTKNFRFQSLGEPLVVASIVK